MIKKLLTHLAFATVIGLLIVPSGCVKEDFDSVPKLIDSSSWVRTLTIAEAKSLITIVQEDKVKSNLIKNLVPSVESDIIIEGTVISSDSTGNFYETVTIMDETGGIDLRINASDTYVIYGLKPGQKVLVRLNDLALGYYHGAYQLGLGITDYSLANDTWETRITVNGLSLAELPKIIQRSGIRTSPNVINVKINEINTSHVQKLIRIDSVQFWNASSKYSIPGETTNRILIDKSGRQIILRNSGYAKFMNDTVPNGSGYITGVLGVYDKTYQLYIRDLNDVQFNAPRFGDEAPTPNKSIAELKALCTSDSVKITQDFIVDGIVVANDEGGNIYQKINIQDETGAIEYSIFSSSLYADFPVGTKIAVNCKGLYVGKYGGVIQLGGMYYSTKYKKWFFGGLDANKFYKSIFIVGFESPYPSIVTPINGINDGMIGKLITLTNVQFIESEMGKTYAESAATNRNIEDENGNLAIVRTSNYADFASVVLPKGKGTLTAILGKFNGDYQLSIRNLGEVRLVEPRRVKNFLLTQDFSSATLNSPITVGSWQTKAEAGTRVWNAKEYPVGSGAKYAEMNPYQSGEASNIGWLISPKVTLTSGTAAFLTFETQFGYWSNSTLKAYISTNYDGTNPATATWTEITQAKIVAYADGQNKWVKSGTISLSEYTGDIYIGFKYTGGGTIGQTTAYRVDNVNIFTQN